MKTDDEIMALAAPFIIDFARALLAESGRYKLNDVLPGAMCYEVRGGRNWTKIDRVLIVDVPNACLVRSGAVNFFDQETIRFARIMPFVDSDGRPYQFLCFGRQP